MIFKNNKKFLNNLKNATKANEEVRRLLMKLKEEEEAKKRKDAELVTVKAQLGAAGEILGDSALCAAGTLHAVRAEEEEEKKIFCINK